MLSRAGAPRGDDRLWNVRRCTFICLLVLLTQAFSVCARGQGNVANPGSSSIQNDIPSVYQTLADYFPIGAADQKQF